MVGAITPDHRASPPIRYFKHLIGRDRSGNRATFLLGSVVGLADPIAELTSQGGKRCSPG